MRRLEELVLRLESAKGVDSVAGPVARFWSRGLSHPLLRDLLSGRHIGHPLRPAAVLFPAGALLSDLVLAASVPAALAGWSDWLDTEQAERRVDSSMLELTSWG